jgi:transglutaminase-like putative cysteine protease
MNEYLNSTEVIDWRHPTIVDQTKRLAGGSTVETARRSFEFVRDEIRHTGDHGAGPVTWRSSDVLVHKTGFCYAKSHLLAALLRASGIPAGLCYQRLLISDGNPPRYALHGLAAVELPDQGWYRCDPRGNKPGIDAQFTPHTERLAFAAIKPGEADLPGVWPEPLSVVLTALQAHTTCDQLAANLPDLDPAALTDECRDVRRVRLTLPYHLRLLAGAQGEIELEVPQPITQRSVLDALEARYPALRGTIRDHVTARRRAFLRLYACELDLSNESPDTPLPPEVASGEAPYQIISAIAGG